MKPGKRRRKFEAEEGITKFEAEECRRKSAAEEGRRKYEHCAMGRTRMAVSSSFPSAWS